MTTKGQFERVFISNVGPIIFRLIWWNYLDSKKRPDFSEDFFDAIMVGLVKTYEDDTNDMLPDGAAQFLRPLVRLIVDAKIGDFASHIPDFHDGTYENFVQQVVNRREESKFHHWFASQYDLFTSRIANLSDDLITTVKLINAEFIIWMKSNSDKSNAIHADAFEQLTGEVLTSHGFNIQFTGRIKNRSADLMAIQKSDHSDDIKYLVECKRYGETKKVGLDILNAVVGASFRAKTSYAMLVTTSSFTSNVIEAHAKLEDFRLDLHNGTQVMEWLADYEFKDFGLWLPAGWQDEWTTGVF